MKDGIPELGDLKNFRCVPTSDFWAFEAFAEWGGVEYSGAGMTEEEATQSVLNRVADKARDEYARQYREKLKKVYASQGIEMSEGPN